MNIQAELGLKVHHPLGQGSYATVYYCTNQNQVYAVKVFLKKDFSKSKLQYFRKQAEILASIQHPNIVKFYQFKQTSSCIYLLMEYIPGGTLRNLMDQKWAQNGSFSDYQISCIVKSILEGIKYLHKFNIIHRDLKPDNILLYDRRDLKTLKIVDFDLSAQLHPNYPKNVKAQCGTLLYMAPEILYEPSYNKGVDIWACSIIMYQLFTGGRHPIYQQGMKSNEFKQLLRNCEFPSIRNELAENLLKKLSKRDYNERYSVNEALQHPWITRNEYDEIPLSVNQLIQSFTIADKVSDALKFCFALGQFQNKKLPVPESYFRKTQQFVKIQEQNKSRSPSMKKMRSKKKDSISKTRQIYFQLPQKLENIKERKNDEVQSSSPLVKKHKHLYLKLFQKDKSIVFQEKVLDLKQCPFPKASIDSEIEIDDEDVPSPCKTQKLYNRKSQSVTHDIKNNKVHFDSQMDIKIAKFGSLGPIEGKQSKMKKNKTLRIEDNISKVDLNLNQLPDKLKIMKRHSFDHRAQSIRNTNKTTSKKSTRDYLLEPMSATRKNSYSSKVKPNNKEMGKKPMIFGMGGASYL